MHGTRRNAERRTTQNSPLPSLATFLCSKLSTTPFSAMNSDEPTKLHASLSERPSLQVSDCLASPLTRVDAGRRGASLSLFSRLSLSGTSSPIVARLRSSRSQQPSEDQEAEARSGPEETPLDASHDSDHSPADCSLPADTSEDSADDEIESSGIAEREGTVIRRRRSQQLSKGRRHQRLSRHQKPGDKSTTNADSQLINSDDGDGMDDSQRGTRQIHDRTPGRRSQRPSRSPKPATKPSDNYEGTAATVNDMTDQSAHSAMSDSHRKESAGECTQRSKTMGGPRRKRVSRIPKRETRKSEEAQADSESS